MTLFIHVFSERLGYYTEDTGLGSSRFNDAFCFIFVLRLAKRAPLEKRACTAGAW